MDPREKLVYENLLLVKQWEQLTDTDMKMQMDLSLGVTRMKMEVLR